SDPISRSNYAVVGKKGSHYKSLSDLSGKTTEVLSGVNYAQVLENWNKNHPNKKPIKIKYVSGTTGVTSRLKNIESGKIDFILYDAISSDYIVKDQSLNLSVSPLKGKIGNNKDGLEYLLLPKDKKG
ncbi:transporter substrate-binding domain-containing protein, partial [Streptococcus agalactiae]|nr:transporter substrate-binding domain-containing protein [Streptococcus agalactiae]